MSKAGEGTVDPEGRKLPQSAPQYTDIEQLLKELAISMYYNGYTDRIAGSNHGVTPNNLGHAEPIMNFKVKEATAQLTTLLTQARIDELKYVQTEYGGRFIATTYIDGDGQTITARISELESELGKGKA